MRNISLSQIIIVLFFGVLLFGDFSKIMKDFHALIKKNKIYRPLKKK
jgi:Sec-independent protein translocase protein TatA